MNRKKEQILLDHRCGMTFLEMKEKYGLLVKNLRVLIRDNTQRKRKLTNEEVIDIRHCVYKSTVTNRELGKKYGVSASLISKISKFLIYADVGGPITSKKIPKRTECHKYRDVCVEEMRYRYWVSDWTAKQIAEKFPQQGRVLPIGSIYNILHKRRYKHVVNLGDSEWERVVQRYEKAA